MRLIFLIFILSLFCACRSTPTFYQPEPLATYRLEKKGDLLMEGSASTSSIDIKSLRANVVYSPIKYLHTGLNYTQIGKKLEIDVSENNWQGFTKGFGAQLGGYYPIGKRSIFNLTSGLSFWQVHNQFDGDKKADLTHQKFDIQACLAMQSGNFRIGYGLRLNWLDYKKGMVNIAIPPEFLTTINELSQNPSVFIPELGIDIGYSFNKFYVKANLVNSVSNLDRSNFSISSTSITFGFMPKFFQKKGNDELLE